MPWMGRTEEKNILKTLTANFMNNFHIGNACFPYKALEQNAKFA